MPDALSAFDQWGEEWRNGRLSDESAKDIITQIIDTLIKDRSRSSKQKQRVNKATRVLSSSPDDWIGSPVRPMSDSPIWGKESRKGKELVSGSISLAEEKVFVHHFHYMSRTGSLSSGGADPQPHPSSSPLAGISLPLSLPRPPLPSH